MKLYFAKGTCSLAVHIALIEAQLPFDLIAVDIRSGQLAAGGDFKQINPKGYVPALQLTDGSILTEAQVVLQYVADQNPQSGLLAESGSRQRYRQLEWLAFISSEVHKGFSPLWKPVTPDAYRVQVKETLAKRFAYLEKELAGKEWLDGARFTLADAYLFTVLSWARWVDVDLTPWPGLQAYVARVAARPSVKQAVHAENQPQ